MESAKRFRKIAHSGFARFRRRRMFEACVLGVSILLPGAFLALGLGMLLRYRPESGWVGPVVLGLAAVGALVIALRYGLRHRLSYAEFLRHVERRIGLGRNELINADELESRLGAIDDSLSRGLAAQAVDAGISQVRQVRFDQLAPQRRLRGAAARTFAAVALAAALFAIAPEAFRSSFARIASPGSYELAPEVRILVRPGDVVLQRGQALDVEAVLPADAVQARLLWRSAEGAWRSIDMRASGEDGEGARFLGTVRGLVEDSEYAVAITDARSRTYDVTVTEPLRALGYRKSVTPPAYTRLPASQELSADGNVSAVFGSELRLGVQTGRPGTQGEIVWEDGQAAQPLEEADDGILVAELRVDEERAYRVRLTAPELGDAEWTSRPFRIDPVQDRLPTLYQLAPETTLDLPPEMVVDLDADCVDDFGLTRLDLVYRRNDRPSERVRLATWSGEREARVIHSWDLEGIALVPGDVIQYHLELTDNDVISGPKTVRGPQSEIRFPSLEELYAETQENRDEQVGDVEALREEQEQLRDELERALQDLKADTEMDWEQQEALKDLAKRQEEVTKKLEDLAEKLDQSLEQMQQAELFSPEMLQKVQEINELAKQIQDPAFKEQMRQLRESLEKLDKNEVEKSLEQMQLSQQDLEQSLDRTLELLQRMKNEEQLDQIVKQAQRMVEQQREINEQLARRLEDPGAAPDAAELPPSPSDEERKAEPQDESDPAEDLSSPQEDASDEAKSAEESSPEQGEENSQDSEAKKSEESESAENQEGDQKEQSAENEQSSASQQNEGQKQEQSPGAQPQSPQGGQQPPEESPQSEDGLTPEERAELQKKQEELQKQLEELKEQLAELQKEAEESWKQLEQEMKERGPKKDLDSAEQNMDQSAEQMPSSPSQSLKFGRQAEQDLEEFAQQMQGAQQQVAQQEQEDITRDLFRISGQLVEVSQNQEDLLGVAPSQPTRDLAAEQSRISQAARLTLDDLNELGKKSRILSPDLTRAMNGAVRALEGSTRSFERGNRQGAMAEGKASTNTLNETVIELLETNDEMCNNPAAGSCNNPMSKMRSLSAQQEKLNGESQSMAGQERLQQQQGGQQALEEMAARQEMIRRGLSELEGSLGDRKDVLGRLDDIAQEMEDVAEEMRERGEIDERILERQQKILSRLLTAQKSIRREDQKEERVSRTGEAPADRESPPPVAEELGRQELLRRGILRGSQDPIPDEFRGLVEDYYQSLSEKP